MTVRGGETSEHSADDRRHRAGAGTVLGGGGRSDVDRSMDYSPDETADLGDLWEVVDSNDLFDREIWGELELLDREEDPACSQSVDNQYREPPDVDFSRFGGRRGGLVRELCSDLETAIERQAFKLLTDRISLIFKKSTPASEREKSLYWVFGAGDDHDTDANHRLRSPGYASFHDCMLALGARDYVIWTRIHFEMYLSWRLLTEPMAFDVVLLPDWLESEIAYSAGFPGISAARFAWCWPGVPEDRLTALPGVTVEILAKMESKGFMAHKSINWFFIGRNPRRLKQRVIWRDDTIRNERRALMNKNQIWEGRLLTWQALWPPQ